MSYQRKQLSAAEMAAASSRAAESFLRMASLLDERECPECRMTIKSYEFESNDYLCKKCRAAC